ncbi:MAG: hypothetical protein IKZ53_01775, partial [Selenomonadaceae bacterium]|nr:hypothetical protein [Selenomonadaceae bacterium]
RVAVRKILRANSKAKHIRKIYKSLSQNMTVLNGIENSDVHSERGLLENHTLTWRRRLCKIFVSGCRTAW